MEDIKNVEIYEDDSVITLYDEKERAIEFYEIASIEYENKFYELLQPVEPSDDIGIDEGEAVILEYIIDEEKEEKIFKPIFDEDLLEKLFSMYLQEVSEYECDDDCGCGCEGGSCNTCGK